MTISVAPKSQPLILQCHQVIAGILHITRENAEIQNNIDFVMVLTLSSTGKNKS